MKKIYVYYIMLLATVLAFTACNKEWEDELGNNFIRISKRYIINLDYVQRINQDIVLKNGKELKIPKVNQKKCRDSYYNYCNRKMKWE